MVLRIKTKISYCNELRTRETGYMIREKFVKHVTQYIKLGLSS